MKTPPRMSRLAVQKYLDVWDASSLTRRNNIVDKFIEDYTTVDPIDTDQLFSRAGALLFTRFTVGMQLAFARRKPVSRYFQALGIFVRSLQGERYIQEFALMGGVISTFDLLRVDEMKDIDKSHVFQFLIRMIEGCGGTRVKEFICSDSSYLESVVDCLTMCKSRTVIHNARLFLQYMCQGNTMTNVSMVSRYVISLLPCDFNPRVQALACRVLPTVIHQNPDLASNCYSLVVDCLKTDYNDMLVDIGELCICIMETPNADDLLSALMEAALPGNVSESLETCKSVSNAGMDRNPRSSVASQSGQASFSSATVERDDGKAAMVRTHDSYFRQQYGALYTLRFILQNNPEVADWVVERGIVGSILAAIGTAPYQEIQLAGVRLLLLVHELSPDCAAAMRLLLPKNLLVILLSEVEDALQYLTAPMCVALRKIGRAVLANWQEWFDGIVLPVTTMQFHTHETSISMPTNLSPVNQEINSYCQTLANLTKEGLFTISDSMPILYLDDSYREYLAKTGTESSRSFTSTARLLSQPPAGEAQIQANPALEGFRKYLVKMDTPRSAMDEDFEKYATGHFAVEQDENPEEMSMTDVETALLEDAMKNTDGGSYEEEYDGEDADEMTEPSSMMLAEEGQLTIAPDGTLQVTNAAGAEIPTEKTKTGAGTGTEEN